MAPIFLWFLFYVFRGIIIYCIYAISNSEKNIHVQIEGNTSYNASKIEISGKPIDVRLVM